MSDWHTKKKIRKRGGEASRVRGLIRRLDKEEKAQLIKDLEAGAEAKHASCVVNGRFSYDKMAELYHKGRW